MILIGVTGPSGWELMLNKFRHEILCTLLIWRAIILECTNLISLSNSSGSVFAGKAPITDGAYRGSLHLFTSISSWLCILSLLLDQNLNPQFYLLLIR